MKTAKVTASLGLAGKIAIQFDIDITDHQSREVLDAIASTLNDSWADGVVTRVEKDKLSLTRKPKDDPDQQDLFKNTVIKGEFVEVEQPQVEGRQIAAIGYDEPAPEVGDQDTESNPFEEGL